MNKFNELLIGFDIEYLGTRQYKMGLSELTGLIKPGYAMKIVESML